MEIMKPKTIVGAVAVGAVLSLYGANGLAGVKSVGDAICTVSDHLLTGESLDADARQSSFTEMMEIALNTAIRL